MKKILFIAPYRKDSAPSQRFRFEQYFQFLEQNGFECTLSSLIATQEEENLFYGQDTLKKVFVGVRMALRRLKDIIPTRKYDIIFIAREAFITGGTFFEHALKASGAKIIYDFDDAIWIDVVSDKNKAFAWLKGASKTKSIIRLADLVIAGNEYLATYARHYNKQVLIIPTTIDTEMYKPKYHLHADPIVIGWSGSRTTIDHFKTVLPVLIRLKEKYGERIGFKVIGDPNFIFEPLGIAGLPWIRERELEDLWSIDIGIMPLPDDEWTKGKCGLKGLQYMALEIPTVMSSVGVNMEIIQDGVNGFLASSTQEWVDKLSLLIDHDDLRISLGREGRRIVEQKFSVNSQKENYRSALTGILG